MNSISRRIFACAVGSLLALVLAPTAYAQDSTLPPTVGYDFCSAKVDANNKNVDEDTTGAVMTLCKESKDAIKAMKAQQLTAVFHAIAGGICTTACVYSPMAGACTYTSLGAGVADIGVTYAVTKDYQQSIGGLTSLSAQALMGLTLRNAAGPVTVVSSTSVGTSVPTGVGDGYTSVETTTNTMSDGSVVTKTTETPMEMGSSEATGPATESTTTEHGGDTASCISAIVEVGTATIKVLGAAESKKTAAAALEEAKAKAMTIRNVSSLKESKIKNTSAATTSMPQGMNPGGSRDTTTLSALKDCSGSQDTNQLISCARSIDPSIPQGFSSPEFQDTFKKLSGQELGQFIKNIPEGASASQIMGAALANTGAGSSVSENAKKYEKYFQDYNDKKYASAAYSGGGAGRGGGAKGGKDVGQQMTDAFGDLLKKMTGEEGGAKANPHVSSIRYGFAKQNPDMLVQNRSVSIFDRVNYRYSQATSRVEDFAWQSPYNRAIASQPLSPPKAESKTPLARPRR